LCEKCLEEGLIRRVEEVHHIVPLDEGGTHAFSNLMSLCKSCHSRFTLTATNSKKKYEDK
jgi:5-methylcytosine-specific restriction protein A